jgi:outer membrane lipoprotein LolB
MNRLRALFLILLLAGCAGAPQKAQRPEQMDAPFAFNGRVVVKQGVRRDKAGVRWMHKAHADEILLLAPLGQTAARIQRDSNRATLEASGRRYVASDMESLMQQALGWQLPLSGMRYWLFGLPVPDDESSIEMAPSGQLGVLRQQGWAISYTKYATESMESLPLRMEMKRDGMEVTLIIDEWELQPQ